MALTAATIHTCLCMWHSCIACHEVAASQPADRDSRTQACRAGRQSSIPQGFSKSATSCRPDGTRFRSARLVWTTRLRTSLPLSHRAEYSVRILCTTVSQSKCAFTPANLEDVSFKPFPGQNNPFEPEGPVAPAPDAVSDVDHIFERILCSGSMFWLYF